MFQIYFLIFLNVVNLSCLSFLFGLGGKKMRWLILLPNLLPNPNRF
jgi:hypothetical protein